MPFLMLNKRRTARINRDRQRRRFRQAQRPHDVRILLAQGMTKDAQTAAMPQQLRITERQIIRTANGLELVRTRPFGDEQRHVIQRLDRIVDRETAEQCAFG
jgi:hypothetical protein